MEIIVIVQLLLIILVFIQSFNGVIIWSLLKLQCWLIVTKQNQSNNQNIENIADDVFCEHDFLISIN